MRVWVGCLAHYNAGTLVGDWVDGVDAAEWKCANASHEETWCFDTDDMPVSREMSPAEAVEMAEAVQPLLDEGHDMGAVRAMVDLGFEEWDTFADSFRDAYAGEWTSVAEYAEDLAEDVGYLAEVPENLRPYIDWDAFARDMGYNGEIYTVTAPNGVYVFRTN